MVLYNWVELIKTYLGKGDEVLFMDINFFSLPIFWIAIAVIAIVVEGCTTQLVSIWLAVSAIITAIIAAFTDSLLLQWMVFVALSIVCILATRPLVHRFRAKNAKVATNSDRYIGKLAEVIVDINNSDGVGQVKVEGSVWSAKTTSPYVLPAGTVVKIDGIEGVKMIVTPVNVTTG